MLVSVTTIHDINFLSQNWSPQYLCRASAFKKKKKTLNFIVFGFKNYKID